MKTAEALALLTVIGSALLACDKNPVGADRDKVDRLFVNPAFITLTVNTEKKVTGYPVNKYGEATFDNVTVAACDAKISVRQDSTRLPVEPPTRVIARGVSTDRMPDVFLGEPRGYGQDRRELSSLRCSPPVRGSASHRRQFLLLRTIPAFRP